LVDIKKEFGGGDEKLVKVAELCRLEQGSRMIKEFVQEFRRAARESGYEGHPLIEEFKQGINGAIKRKLIEAKHYLRTVKQWYKRAVALDRNWRESKREEERLRGQREAGGMALRQQEQKSVMLQPLVW